MTSLPTLSKTYAAFLLPILLMHQLARQDGSDLCRGMAAAGSLWQSLRCPWVVRNLLLLAMGGMLSRNLRFPEGKAPLRAG